MNRTELLVDSGQMYALTVDPEENLYLEVACGSFAMFNMVVPLSDDDHQKYLKHGKDYLDQLAFMISKNPKQYESRAID